MNKKIDKVDIELANLRRQNQLILNSVGEGIYGLDIQGNVTFVNPAAAEIIGWDMDDLVGKSMHKILHHSKCDGSHYPREECPIYAAFRDGKVRRVENEVFWRKDGTSFPVEYISTPMHDEKGELVGAVVTFRDITQRKLSESILQRTNEELEERVAQRTQELSQANEQLKQLNEIRSRFVGMVCHEFRNPLNNISFLVSSLRRYTQKLSTNKKDEYLLDIKTNIDRMTQMTDELLVISKIDNEQIDSDSNWLDLVEFCQRIIIEFERANNNQNQIDFTYNSPKLRAKIDGRLLQSIIINLLSNAVKYSPDRAEIKLDLNLQGDRLIIVIEDWGIGIPQKDKELVFEPFHRGKNVSNIPGTGLGLHIVKKFVSILDGQIKITSQESKGTKVEVIILL
ncbi:MAG: ATP-binding protein [Cyanobacteria bacterium P01_G01_bin.19]